MPAFNAEKTVKSAVNSVLSQLHKNDELLIVDDASTDNTTEIIDAMSDPRITILKHKENQGISSARNTALKKITGDYVCFMDADDLWPKGRQAAIRKAIIEHNADIIFGIIEHFYCPSLTCEQRQSLRLPKTQLGAIPGSVILSHKCIKAIGPFDNKLKIGEFIDYFSRAKQHANTCLEISNPVLRRRIHSNNYTLINRSKKHDYLKVIRKHLARESNNA